MNQSYEPLALSSAATSYQRDWTRSLRSRIADGEPYVFANADTPQEICHAHDVPVVTNQWWSAVIAAKKLSTHYLDALEHLGFHDRLARYSSLPLAARLVGDRELQPWGGLPDPALLCARQSSDDHQQIFALWADATGAPLQLFSAPAIPNPSAHWWTETKSDWEQFHGSARLDLAVAEMEDFIGHVEAISGRAFNRDNFATLMKRIHEQETIFSEADDLIAAAPQAPLRISEQIPNVMIPQWHRGSDWALEHAHAFKDAIGERVRTGVSVVERERTRMMWIGAGLWFDTQFYSAFEDSHNAVFAWSMYLPFAADGYLRQDYGDPLRTLAARVATMNEQLHQPPWVNEWLVYQAERYRIDVAVMLVPTADRPSGQGSYFAKHALEAAGIRVVEIWADMVDERAWDRQAAYDAVAKVL